MILFFKFLIFIIFDILLEEVIIPKMEFRDGVTYLERNNIFRKIIQLLIITATTFEVSSLEIIVLAIKKDNYFIYLAIFSLLLAVSTVLAGIVEAKIAIFNYVRSHPQERIVSKEDKRRIAKLGGRKYVHGRGVYDYSKTFMVYAAMCNILGALTILSILLYLRGVPEYLEYLQTRLNKAFAILIEFCAPFSIYICLLHTYKQQVKSQSIKASDFENDLEPENLSVYTFRHFHVHLNMLHFWFTISMLLFLFSTYGLFILYNFQTVPIRWTLIMPLIFATLFFLYSGGSAYAKRIEAISRSIVLSCLRIMVGVCILLLLTHKITEESSTLFLPIVVICYFLKLSHKEVVENEVVTAFDIPIAILLAILLLICILFFLKNLTETHLKRTAYNGQYKKVIYCSYKEVLFSWLKKEASSPNIHPSSNYR